MKLLILTQYFPPEVGAPQNRLYELAVRLKKKGVDITILTAIPNYPQMEIYDGYKKKWYCYEEFDGLKVHRSWIFVRKNKSIFFRLMNYFSFVFSSIFTGWFKLRKFDFILCESPPLFLGITAYILKRLKKSKLIFNVSDLWPESAEKLGLVKNKFFLKLSTRLEEFTYKHSELITGQTQGIVNNISERFPDKKIFWLKNGVDPDFYCPDKIKDNWRKKNAFKDNDLIFLYAGILGYAQGLEVILKAAFRLKDKENIKFVFYGNGPEKEKLIKTKTELNLKNIYFYDPVPKSDLPYIIKGIDAAIIPLKRLELFKGAIPSKIFENLAMKKPILLGIEGEAKELLIDEGKCGLAFIPEDDNDLFEKILTLYNSRNLIDELGENGRKYVSKNFNRDIIIDDFYKFII